MIGELKENATFNDEQQLLTPNYETMKPKILDAVRQCFCTVPKIKEYIGAEKKDDISDILDRMIFDELLVRIDNGTITGFFDAQKVPSKFWLDGSRKVFCQYEDTPPKKETLDEKIARERKDADWKSDASRSAPVLPSGINLSPVSHLPAVPEIAQAGEISVEVPQMKIEEHSESPKLQEAEKVHETGPGETDLDKMLKTVEQMAFEGKSKGKVAKHFNKNSAWVYQNKRVKEAFESGEARLFKDFDQNKSAKPEKPKKTKVSAKNVGTSKGKFDIAAAGKESGSLSKPFEREEPETVTKVDAVPVSDSRLVPSLRRNKEIQITPRLPEEKQVSGFNYIVGNPPHSNSFDNQIPTDPANSRTVHLGLAGKVRLEVLIDPFELTGADREFVFGLIDTVKNYQSK